MLVGSGGADELDRVTPWAPLLAAMAGVPSISGAADPVALRDLVDRRLEVIRRLGAGLEEASSRQPVLVVVDDLQWADPATLLALGSLPRQLFSYPVAWILARRPVPAVPQMHLLLSRLADSGVTRLALGALDPAASAAVATDILGGALSGRQAELVTQAGGNPFYVIELLKTAPADGVPGRGSKVSGAVDVPRSFRDAVAVHLHSLSESASQFVKVACVLGRVFSVAEVSAMTGDPASRLLSSVEELLAAEVVVADGNRLAFRHDLLRQAVYQDLPVPVREALHRDAATVLMDIGAPLLRVAGQLAVSATPGDERAITLLDRAVQELGGDSAGAAADLAMRVLELVAPDDPRRPDMVARAVRRLGWAGRVDEALALGEDYLAEHHLPPPAEAAITLNVRMAWTNSRGLPYPRPMPAYLLSDPSVPPAIRANLIALLQMQTMGTRRWEDADTAFAEAARLAGESQGSDGETATVFWLWLANALLGGQYLAAIERQQRGLEMIGADPINPDYAALASCAVEAAMAVQPPTETLSAIATAAHAAEVCGYTYVSNRCQWLRAGLLLDRGDLDHALAEARSAALAAEDLGFYENQVYALSVVTETALRQGEVAAATAAANRLGTHPEIGSAEAEVYWARALCADARGRPELALDALSRVFAQLQHGVFLIAVWHPDRLPRLVALAQRADDNHRAADVAGAAERLAQLNPHVRAVDAVRAHARGLVEHDPELLRHAAEVLREDGRPLAAASALEDLGRVLTQSGGLGDGIGYLERAYAAYASANARRDTARVRKMLRQHGIRKRQAAVARPGRGWASLTNAELAVVRIVAQGHTNREAGHELFLSPDTVNTHLRHAFAKLEIRSRAELVRVVIEHEGREPQGQAR